MEFCAGREERRWGGKHGPQYIHFLNLCHKTELFSHTSVFNAESVMRQSPRCKSSRQGERRSPSQPSFCADNDINGISHLMMGVSLRCKHGGLILSSRP